MIFDAKNFNHGISAPTLSRRAMLSQSVLGFGAVGLASLLADEGLLQAAGSHSGVPGNTHFPATAKNVIFLFMSGAPSQVDTFDPKPMLTKLEGQAVPESIAARVPNIPRAGLGSKLMASPFSFKNYGESGIPVSSLFPETAKMIDEICVLRSVNHRVPVHGPGECISLTGSAVGDRPSLGAWLTYGLGSESRDLPGFISMLSNSSGPAPQTPGWGNGFLPSRYQGTLVDGKRGIPYTKMPTGYSQENRREQLDFIKWMNEEHLAQLGQDSELEARIASYELGFRLQTSAPEVFDLKSESAETAQLYGLDDKATSEFGRHCLIARRLVERGVRVVQLRNGGWDAHGAIKANHTRRARATDKPVAALLQDLKQRGLLDDTLVIWGGEFGRTPTTEGSAKGDRRGRDHLPTTYCMWMAGGGIKGGQILGQTDELGYTPVERPVSPADLHATLLHAMGLDQHKLIYMHNNRKEIATVLGGEVISEVFA